MYDSAPIAFGLEKWNDLSKAHIDKNLNRAKSSYDHSDSDECIDSTSIWRFWEYRQIQSLLIRRIMTDPRQDTENSYLRVSAEICTWYYWISLMFWKILFSRHRQIVFITWEFPVWINDMPRELLMSWTSFSFPEIIKIQETRITSLLKYTCSQIRFAVWQSFWSWLSFLSCNSKQNTVSFLLWHTLELLFWQTVTHSNPRNDIISEIFEPLNTITLKWLLIRTPHDHPLR